MKLHTKGLTMAFSGLKAPRIIRLANARGADIFVILFNARAGPSGRPTCF